MKVWRVISVCFLLVCGIRAKCKCNLKDLIKEAHILRNNLANLDKRELPDVDEEANESYSSDPTTEEIEITAFVNTPQNDNSTNYEIDLEQNEAEIKTSNIKQVCPHYKEVPDLLVHKMANIWQVAYYKPAQTNITCFRMYIERVSYENRQSFNEHFSSFNGSIDWEKCYIEIVKVVRIDDSEDFKRRHFLQGDAVNEKAVLENILLTENFENATKTITLIEESPDQWMTYKNLLLMRDCELGTVVVFTKVPTYANILDVERALRIFGEEDVTEKASCPSEFNQSPSLQRYNRSMKYKILS